MQFYTKKDGDKLTKGVKMDFLNFHAWFTVDAKEDEKVTEEKK